MIAIIIIIYLFKIKYLCRNIISYDYFLVNKLIEEHRDLFLSTLELELKMSIIGIKILSTMIWEEYGEIDWNT